MIKPNITYLAFDDRKLMLFGIPILTVLIPFLFFGIDGQQYWGTVHIEFWHDVAFTLVFWLFNRGLIIALRKRYSIAAYRIPRLALQLLIIIPVIPVLSFFLDYFCDTFFNLILPSPDPFEPTMVQGVMATYFLTFALAAVYEAIYFFYKYKEAILENEQIQRLHIQGQLDNLRNQINPHFLFNSLNTLMNLIPTDPERAMTYLSKLSKFYRYAVSEQEKSLVPLTIEIENVRLFADLLHERFHKSIQIDISEDLPQDAQILPLCLQMLIENAVKHNIVAQKYPLSISIKAVKENAYIQVTNNIQKKIQEMSSTGMGLKNIKNRMTFFTPRPLEIEEDDQFFAVSIPLIYSIDKL